MLVPQARYMLVPQARYMLVPQARYMLVPQARYMLVPQARYMLVPQARYWLKKHLRFKFHFVPTSCSSLDMVERFFAETNNKRLSRGLLTSTKELEQKIYQYLAVHNANPKPLVWRKTADQFKEKSTAPDNL